MKKALFSLLCLWAVSLMAYAQTETQEKFTGNASDYFNRADKKYDSQDHEGAIEDYTKAIKLNSSYTIAYSNRGMAKEKIGDYEGAIEDFSIAKKLDPSRSKTADRKIIELNEKLKAKQEIARNTKVGSEGADSSSNKSQEVKQDDKIAKGAGNTIRDKFYKGNYKEVVDDCTKAVSVNPKDKIAYYYRGRARIYLRDYKGSSEDFNKAIELDPEFAEAYIGKGIMIASLEADSGDSDIHLNLFREYYLGRVWYNIENHENAIKYYDKAIDINPKLLKAYCYKIMSGGQVDGQVVSRIKPKDEEDWFALGLAQRTYKGQCIYEWQEQAIKCFSKAIDINPQYLEAYIGRGCEGITSDTYVENAIADLKKAININPNYDAAYVSLGRIEYKHGNFKDFIADWLKAAELELSLANNILNFFDNPQAMGNANLDNDTYAMLYYKLGIVKEKHGNYEDAKAEWEKALAIDSKYEEELKAKIKNVKPAIYYSQGNKKYSQSDYGGAISDYSKAIELKPEYADAYNNRGVARYQIRDYKSAIDDFDKAISLNPNFTMAYDSRANAKFQLANYDGAVADWEKAIQLEPSWKDKLQVNIDTALSREDIGDNASAEDYKKRGVAKYKLKDYKGAVADWEKAIQIDNSYKDKLQPEIDNAKEADAKAIAELEAAKVARAKKEAEDEAKAPEDKKRGYEIGRKVAKVMITTYKDRLEYQSYPDNVIERVINQVYPTMSGNYGYDPYKESKYFKEGFKEGFKSWIGE